jgi:hypothetical protein
MKIRNSKWSIFLTSILIFQLVLSSICLIDFQTKFSHHQNEIVLKQLDSNSQAIEETESLFVMIEETKEEMELNYFSINLTKILNFSTKSWFALDENLDSRNFSLIPYSPPEKVS